MASISIKNIGPLKDTGVIELKTVNLFIGRQSTGKSTLMKIICFCRWLEKCIMAGPNSLIYTYTHNGRFLNELKLFYRFNDSYFSGESSILYCGDCVNLVMNGNIGNVRIERLESFDKRRFSTKLCFIPSERNLLSAFRNIDRSYRTSDLDLLFNYILEWEETKGLYTNNTPKVLAVASDMEYYFDKEKNSDMIRLKSDSREFSTFYVSSGVQSALPVEVLVDYVCGMVGKPVPVSKGEFYDMMRTVLQRKPVSEDLQDGSFVSSLSHLVNYQSAQLFIEEVEQNLYPESQWKLVRSIVGAVKRAVLNSEHNSMVLFTTHSPYVLTALNVLMLASAAAKKNYGDASAVVPSEYLLPAGSFGAYYLAEDGTVSYIVDDEVGMIDGLQLDGISDKAEEEIAQLNFILYGR